MSYRALLLAVRDELRDRLELKPIECEITIDGQPIPSCGERFIAVSQADWSTQQTESLDEDYAIDVTVSMRLPRVPVDKEYKLIVQAITGFADLASAVRAALHGDIRGWAVVNRANATIGPNANGFCEPLRFRGGSRPQVRGGSWFWAKREPRAGVAQVLHFREARLVQDMTTQT